VISPNESDRNLEAALSDDDVPANQRDLMGAIVDGEYCVSSKTRFARMPTPSSGGPMPTPSRGPKQFSIAWSRA
jgi:hypothetical protein